MEGVVVRKPKPEELQSAEDVWYRSHDRSVAWLRPEQRRAESEERGHFRNVVAKQCELWVAVHRDEILGVLAIDDGVVDRLYVDPPIQSQKVGSLLLDQAKRLNPAGLRLVTLRRNQRARRFYEAHGFVPYACGCSPAPEDEPDVLYRWPSDSV